VTAAGHRGSQSQSSGWQSLRSSSHPSGAGDFEFQVRSRCAIYVVLELIIFFFKDLDENKPSGSIRIRRKTIDYFLRRYRDWET
jgi:hypothetical protein